MDWNDSYTHFVNRETVDLAVSVENAVCIIKELPLTLKVKVMQHLAITPILVYQTAASTLRLDFFLIIYTRTANFSDNLLEILFKVVMRI